MAPLTSIAAPMSQFRTFTIHGNFAAAGTGMRNTGFGTITIGSIPTDATVLAAYLYWVVLNPTMPAATGTFGESSISGALLGSGANPCWNGRDDTNTTVDAGSAWTFRADVTAFVSSPGNGSYALSGFPSGESGGQDPFLDSVNNHLPLLEGASLVIVYFSPSEPQRDIVIYDGNASVPDSSFNDTAILALTGFEVAPTGTPSARFAFIGADGQTNFPDQDLFNGTVLTALGASPWDGSDGPQYTYGSLWDTDIFDVSALMSPGDTTCTAAVHSPTEGSYDCVVWSAAVLAVDSTDPSPPLCESSTAGTGATAVVNGSATDAQPGDTGIVSVALDPSSTNIACTGCQTYFPGTPSVTFSLSLAGGTTGSGSVIVTDGAGKTCRVGASYTGVAQGAVTDQALFIDRTQGVKFFVAQGTALTSDTAVVDSSPPGTDNVACLPACFEFPPKSLVLTVTSPIDGPALVDYDIDIAFDPDLRLLSRHPDLAGSCPYQDITTSVQNIAFDPRLRGSVTYSRVQFVAGRQIASCPPPLVATDADGDLYFVGGSTDPTITDCDDANPNIHPGATEICNGIDDNCNGLVDENACGTVEIAAFLHTVGVGNSPTVNSAPMPGAEVRLFDARPGSCAATVGISPKNYLKIYGPGTSLSDQGCLAVSSVLTDALGHATFAVAPGTYIAIARPPAPHDGTRIGVTVGGVAVGGVVRKRVQLIVTADGSELPARTINKGGTDLMIVQPELVAWNGAIKSYPIIFRSESLWSISTTVVPPLGVVSDQPALSTTVSAGTSAVQFNVYNAAEINPSIGLSYTLSHLGTTETLSTLVLSLLALPPGGDSVTISKCQGSWVYSTRSLSWSYVLQVAAGTDRAGSVRMGAIDISSLTSPRLLGSLEYDSVTQTYWNRFALKRKPSSVMALSSAWGYATCSP